MCFVFFFFLYQFIPSYRKIDILFDFSWICCFNQLFQSGLVLNASITPSKCTYNQSRMKKKTIANIFLIWFEKRIALNATLYWCVTKVKSWKANRIFGLANGSILIISTLTWWQTAFVSIWFLCTVIVFLVRLSFRQCDFVCNIRGVCAPNFRYICRQFTCGEMVRLVNCLVFLLRIR